MEEKCDSSDGGNSFLAMDRGNSFEYMKESADL